VAERAEFDPERIVLQAASIDPDAREIEAFMGEILKLAHAEDSDLRIGSVKPAFGWNFYVLSVSRMAVSQLAQLPGSDILKTKGDTLEQKFVNWLNRQTKKKSIDDKLHFNLLSDLKSSRYGLF
jgi:hypothetical protein